MTKPAKRVRCAIYIWVSTEYGLDQEFNSLDAQHEASEAYIRSQAHEGWTSLRTRYDDGGYSGGPTERPALQRLLADIRDRRIDVVVVYKVDRLTRSLAQGVWVGGMVPLGYVSRNRKLFIEEEEAERVQLGTSARAFRGGRDTELLFAKQPHAK
jgi:Resolvase, N terminal domain